MKLKQMNLILIALSLLTVTASCQQQKPFPDDDKDKVCEYVDNWQEGYLDIHQISTGRGNCTFMILPDGTTFMVDAGDLGDEGAFKWEIMPRRPNGSKAPAEWIARYVKHFSEPLDNDGKLDYLMITHFDADHVGGVDKYAVTDPTKDYLLSGVTHLAQLVDIGLILDRGYPEYDFPSKDLVISNNKRTFPNYHIFVKERVGEGGRVEKQKAGSNTQIRLLNKPEAYPGFEIRNIIVNGMMWNGTGENTVNIFSTLGNGNPGENHCSSAIRMSYGKFKYYSGGDAIGRKDNNRPWVDMETQIADAIGETDVVLCDHHASSDAMNEEFVGGTKAQAYIIPVWDYYHPEPVALARMLDKTLYSSDRLIFAAGMVASNRIRLGDDGKKIEPDGHILTRVYPGGNEFQIFVLNDRSEEYEIIHKTEKILSK